jgi:hypothetical protein
MSENTKFKDVQVVDAHTSVSKTVKRYQTVEQQKKAICESFEIRAKDVVSLRSTDDEDVTDEMLKETKNVAIILTTNLHGMTNEKLCN